MGVRTTADENRDEAKAHIGAAYKLLMNVLDSDTWGSSDYKSDYIAEVEEAVITLARLKRKL